MSSKHHPLTEKQDIETGRSVAVLAYITLIGWVVAFILHGNRKTSFGAFHLRQALGLFILTIVLAFIVLAMSFVLRFMIFLMIPVQLAVIVFILLQVSQAVNGKRQGLPLIGPLIDRFLSGLN